MNYWRMSFKDGNRGYDIWEQCIENDVAVIGYAPFVNIDLSEHDYYNPKKNWLKLSPSQHASLRRFGYEFNEGDIIFIKSGKKIVGQGVINGEYNYQRFNSLRLPNGKIFGEHLIPVIWDRKFIPLQILVGKSQQFTIEQLTITDVNRINRLKANITKIQNELEVEEGEEYLAEIKFRKRNRAIIEAKKANSDGSCVICGFNYSKFYKKVHKNHLIAHHLNPIALRKKAKITRLEDLALVCSNCHTIIHSQIPQIDINLMLKRVRKN